MPIRIADDGVRVHHAVAHLGHVGLAFAAVGQDVVIPLHQMLADVRGETGTEGNDPRVLGDERCSRHPAVSNIAANGVGLLKRGVTRIRRDAELLAVACPQLSVV
jgi:hypothetical protein